MYGNNPWALAPGLEDDSSIVEQVQVNISETHDEDGVPLEYNDPESGESIPEPIEAEAAEAELEVQEAEDVVEKLQETGEDLESHLVGIESRINSEVGLTSNEVETMMVSLRHTFPAIRAIHPGVESFNNNRIAASLEVKDRIVQGLKDLWDKIKRAIERVRVKMTQWYAKLLGKASRTKRKVQAIKAKAQKTKGGVQDDTIEISGIADKVCDKNGKMPGNASAIKAQLDNLLKAVTWAYGPVASTSKSVTKKAKEGFKTLVSNMSNAASSSNGNGGTAADMSLIASLVSSSDINAQVRGGPASTYSMSNDPRFTGLADIAFVELPGNKAIFYRSGVAGSVNGAVNANAGDVAIDKHFANIGPIIDAYDNVGNKTVENKQDFATLQSAMVVSICDTVISILTKIVEFESGYRDVVNVNKELQREIDSAVSKAERDKNLKDKPSYLALTSKLIRGSGKIMQINDKFFPAFTSYILSLVNAYMLWCTKSLANHSMD